MDERRLDELLTAEFAALPLEFWVDWAPARIAVWRFVSERRPDILGVVSGRISAGITDFSGPGADWFQALEDEPRYQQAVDSIMRSTLDRVPSAALERGFLKRAEVPGIEFGVLSELRAVIAERVASSPRAG